MEYGPALSALLMSDQSVMALSLAKKRAAMEAAP
jgi:hypothetical protein